MDAGRILVSPWGGGYTFSEPGMKKVAAERCHFTVGETAKDVIESSRKTGVDVVRVFYMIQVEKHSKITIVSLIPHSAGYNVILHCSKCIL